MKKYMSKFQDIHTFVGRGLYCYLERNKHIWKVNTQAWTLKNKEQRRVWKPSSKDTIHEPIKITRQGIIFHCASKNTDK